MSKLAVSGVLSVLALLGSAATSHADINLHCRPPLIYVANVGCFTHANYQELDLHKVALVRQDGERHYSLYGNNLQGNHPIAGHKY